jgi:hypothetical protein
MLNYENICEGTTVSGPLLTTPDTVIDRMQKVNGDMQSFDVTVQANAAKLQPGFGDAWGTFLKTWKAFVANNSNRVTMLISPGTGTVMREIDDYVARLQAFAQGLQAELPGVHFAAPLPGATPNPNAPPPGPGDKEEKSSSFGLPWWAVSLLTLLGIGGLAYLGISGYRMIAGVEHSRRSLQRAAERHLTGGEEPAYGDPDPWE